MYKVYKADWILTGNEQIVENGAVLVKDGKIVDIVTANESFDNFGEVVDYKKAVITPGFINLHTHLQYTDLKKESETPDFISWITSLISSYSKWNSSQKINSLKNGLKEALLSGTTCIAQLSAEEEFFETLNNCNIRIYLFLETFSNSKEMSMSEFEKLKQKIAVMRQKKSDMLNIGISPHSVYNVHEDLWRKIAKFSRDNDILIHTHLAESRAEMQWLEKGYSEVNLIHEFVNWDKLAPFKTGLTPVQYLEELGMFEGKNLILAHLNQLEEKDFEKLIKYDAKIVHCPRSNLMLHGKTLDIVKYIYDLKIGIGTDSRFSNDDLNILNEARFIKNKTGLGLLKLLDMLTINAAKILRLDDKIGSLEKGKEADFLVFRLNDNETYSDFINKGNPDDIYIKGKQVIIAE